MRTGLLSVETLGLQSKAKRLKRLQLLSLAYLLGLKFKLGLSTPQKL
jgi:hypothetical protein